MRAGILILALWLFAELPNFGMSYAPPAFRGPQIFADRIVFGEPGDSRRVICVRRDGGGKLWEIRTDSFVTARRVDDRLLLAESGKVFEADLKTGGRTMLFKSGLPYCEVIDRGGPIVLALSYSAKEGEPSLMAFRKEGWEKLWERELVESVAWDGGAYLFAYNYHLGIAGLRRDSGECIWERDLGGFGRLALVENHLVLNEKGCLMALRQDNGDVVKVRRFEGGEYLIAHVYPRGKNVLICRNEGKSLDPDERWQLQEYAVPSLRLVRSRNVADRTAVGLATGNIGISVKGAVDLRTGKTIWRRPFPSWETAVADGRIYGSLFDEESRDLIFEEVELATGKQREIYRERVNAASPAATQGDEPIGPKKALPLK